MTDRSQKVQPKAPRVCPHCNRPYSAKWTYPWCWYCYKEYKW